MCQYNNIYKRKKNTNGRLWKKKKPITTVVTVPLGTIAIVQNFKKKNKLIKNKNGRTKWLNKPKWHCKGIASFYIANRLIEIIAKD